jgi:hypothetical protein
MGFSWLAAIDPLAPSPAIPPAPTLATCSTEFGEALRRIAGKPGTPAPTTAL